MGKEWRKFCQTIHNGDVISHGSSPIVLTDQLIEIRKKCLFTITEGAKEEYVEILEPMGIFTDMEIEIIRTFCNEYDTMNAHER